MFKARKTVGFLLEGRGFVWDKELAINIYRIEQICLDKNIFILSHGRRRAREGSYDVVGYCGVGNQRGGSGEV
jgi:hypothetical protein